MPNGCVYSCLFCHVVGRGDILSCLSPFYQKTEDRKRVYGAFCLAFAPPVEEIALFLHTPSVLLFFSIRIGSQLRRLLKFGNSGKRISILLSM